MKNKMDKMKKAYIQLFVGFGSHIILPLSLIYLFGLKVWATIIIAFVNGYVYRPCVDVFRATKKLCRYVDRVSHKEELCAKIDDLLLFLEEEEKMK